MNRVRREFVVGANGQTVETRAFSRGPNGPQK